MSSGPHIISATKQPGLKIGVAVDGARISEKAFVTALALVDKRRGDRLLLLNVTDPDTKAGGQKGHEHVMRQYQGICIDHRVEFDWNHRQRNIVKEDTLIAGVNNLAEELGCDLLVTGCQSIEEGGCFMILGEETDSSFWKKDTCIVKSTSFKATQPLKFLLATDNSAPSRLAFQRALTLLKPEDSLVLLNVSSRNEVAPLFWQFYEAEMKKAGVHGSTLYVQSTSVSQAVLQTARDLQADVLIVGAIPKGDGLGLGSVSRDLLKDCRCSFLLVQAREAVTTSTGTLEKPSSHFSGQAREWGRTDSMQQGLPSQQSSERWPQGPRRSGSKNDGQMMSPTKRTSHDSTGSAAGVEEQMSLLEMFEEQKRQHLRQQMSGRGPTVTPRNSANEIGGPGQKGDSDSHHLAHIQSGVILQDGDE